jgi:hypothetical protein
VATSAAVIAACKLVLETNVVVRAVPFHCTFEEDTKLEPVTVSGNAAPPAAAELGFKDAIVGAALALLIVNVNALLVPPPGLGVETETCAVAAVAMSAAVIAACKPVPEMNVLPFHSTVEADMKFVPVTVRVKPGPPAAAELGLREPVASDGVGLTWG